MHNPADDIVTQGNTAKWKEARLGRFTASVFHEIVCARGKPTQAMLSRCASVAAERLTGIEAFSGQTKAMEWGLDMELQAFEFLCDNWTELQGATFVPYKENAGATPDAYASIYGTLCTVDIKCPFTSSQFVQWVAAGEGLEDLKRFKPEYYWQVLAQARFCGTEMAALVYYDPRMPGSKRWLARTYQLLPEAVEIIDQALSDAERETQRFMALMQA